MAAVRDGSAPFERFETRLDATGDPWLLVKDSERELIDLLNGAWPQLGDIATVGQGMQTGENNAFAVTDKIASNLKIPAQLLKRRVRNSDVERFGYTLRDESLLYLEDVLVYELLPSALRALLEQPGDRVCSSQGPRSCGATACGGVIRGLFIRSCMGCPDSSARTELVTTDSCSTAASRF